MTFTPSPELRALLEQMSRDMGVPVEGLVNQAIFNWARLHGTLEATIVEDPEPAWLAAGRPRRVFLVLADRELELSGERFVVGRDMSCDLTLESARLSRQHVAILVGPERVEVEDLASSNGTWYQGQRITRREVASGDEFFFGDVPVKIELR